MVKVPAKITPSYLENAALHYLERFASSSANLRRVLMRKVARSVAHWGGDTAEHTPQVEEVVAKLARLGYVNDAAYAEAKVRALHRAGKGSRTIRATLAAKGVAADHAAAAFDALAEDVAEPDLAAAIRLARKRRLGPFRRDGRAETRNKDLAALARAGFDFDICRRIIDAESAEALEEVG
ncbi:regulatory protein RecX [Magnetospirillum aberrantis]|uniref:Regulatory protein RecX n=1 Tax=Magnetospirillum aberrantis SpK TaxID=908842 RepID=A0A7C9UYJ7_9PROT|nr:regulatory protein RecX [Magnetospirillum aberrantis]NFV82069.1 regulatory protein RecX [Magnetospirillum aberrantis SpK]